MSLKLTKEFIINGHVVELSASFAGIEAYTLKEELDDETTVFFVKDDEVVQTLNIQADCGQSLGYISELTFKGE